MSFRARFLLLGCLACTTLPDAGVPRPPLDAQSRVDLDRELDPEPGASASPRSRVQPPDPEFADRVPLWLPTFYESLQRLRAGESERHVRVLWYGDSHTAADFWTDAVREPLQAQFGAGGPGLVMIGLPRYRHGLVLLDSSGPWRRMPESPAGTRPRDDGVLGLAGLVAVPGDASSSASVRVRDADWAHGRLRWEVLYRLRSDDAAFDLRPEGESAERIRAGIGVTRASGISSFTRETEGAREMQVERFAGQLELLGLVVEGLKPGVVFDTLGINGARAATPLSWDEAAWVDEVRAREPALVILSYGTNEVGDVAAADTYREHYTALVRRLRLAAPQADCLIVGPTDRARPDWQTNPRVVEIEQAQKVVSGELGCAFFSPFDAMGGPGSLRRWAFENPPRARRDRVHLTLRGYQHLGAQLANRLLESFRAVYETEP